MMVSAGKMGYVYAIDPANGKLIWKVPVGDHNGRDNDSRKALADPGSVTITPPIEIEPGVYGGVETNMAYQDGVVYAAISNLATTMSDLDVNYGGATGTFDYEGNEGEMVALDVKTGRVIWTTCCRRWRSARRRSRTTWCSPPPSTAPWSRCRRRTAPSCGAGPCQPHERPDHHRGRHADHGRELPGGGRAAPQVVAYRLPAAG